MCTFRRPKDSKIGQSMMDITHWSKFLRTVVHPVVILLHVLLLIIFLIRIWDFDRIFAILQIFQRVSLPFAAIDWFPKGLAASSSYWTSSSVVTDPCRIWSSSLHPWIYLLTWPNTTKHGPWCAKLRVPSRSLQLSPIWWSSIEKSPRRYSRKHVQFFGPWLRRQKASSR